PIFDSIVLLPNALHLFQFFHMSSRVNGTISRVFVSFYQIYMESICDLLVTPTGIDSKKNLPQQHIPSLPIREDPHRGIIIEGLTTYIAKCEEAVFSMISVAVSHRTTRSQGLNDSSSRS